MLHSARSHGRALHALLQPRARLNVASNPGKRTWNGTLQLQLEQRRHWTKYPQQPNKEFFEDQYAVATALKKTGVFSARKGARRIKKGAPTGDGNRVNIVNPNLASTMPLPSAATPPPPDCGLLMQVKQNVADLQPSQRMSSRTSNPRSSDTRDAISSLFIPVSASSPRPSTTRSSPDLICCSSPMKPSTRPFCNHCSRKRTLG